MSTENFAKENEHRHLWVIAWAAIGALLGVCFIYSVRTSQSELISIIKSYDNRLIAPMLLLIISAPLSLCFWWWRNKDKLKQIAQTDEQNKFNSFSNAMRLFLEESGTHAKATGLRILAKIRKESDAFRAEIDMATSGAKLEEGDLTNADLTGIDLSRATLTKAFLTKANLLNTDLAEANLTSASMLGINLTGANLKNATLNDLVIGIDEEYVYDEDKKQPLFTRAEIEDYLKKDWKEHKTHFPAQVKEKEKNKIYYFEGKTNLPPDMTDSSHKKPPPKRRGRPSKPKGSPPKPKGPSSASTLPSKAPTARPASADLPPTPPVSPITPTDSSGEKKMLHFGIRESDRPTHATEGDADAYFNRGKTKLDSDDFDGAIKDFDKVIELDSNHAGAYRFRALAKMRKGME